MPTELDPKGYTTGQLEGFAAGHDAAIAEAIALLKEKGLKTPAQRERLERLRLETD